MKKLMKRITYLLTLSMFIMGFVVFASGDIDVLAEGESKNQESNTYSITYDLDGGVLSGENPSSYAYGGGYVTLNSPTKDGYTFDHWMVGKWIELGGIGILQTETGVAIYNGLLDTGAYNENLFLTACWKADSYTIHLDGNGGNSESGDSDIYIICQSDEEIDLTAYTYLRDGYTFSGWNSQADGKGDWYTGTVSNIAEEMGSEIVMYAIWKGESEAENQEQKTYSITYELDGGVLAEENPSSYVHDSGYLVLNSPTKEGYTFDCWKEGVYWRSEGKWRGIGAPISVYYYTYMENTIHYDWFPTSEYEENLVLVACWKANNYTIHLDGNGGSSKSGKSDTYIDCQCDENIDLTSYTYTRDAYTFAGWNSKADGKGTWYSEKVSNMAEETGSEVTLYAIWEKNTYTISSYLCGGKSCVDNPKEFDVESDIVLEIPTRKGYTFAGWYYDSNYKTPVKAFPDGKYSDLKLYAKWTPIEYYISFKGNGSTSGTMSSMKNKYDTSYKLTANKFQKKNYEFVGWNTKANGTGTTYGNQATVKNLAKTKGTTVTLYAMWKPKEYKITYNLNGGGTNKNPGTYNVTSAITLSNPVRDGYAFAGWYSDSSCKNKVTKISKGTTGNKTFYAKWTPYKYNVVFNGNGSTGGTMSSLKNCRYGDTYKLAKNNFSKDYYEFAGWNTKANGTGKSYSDGGSIKNLTTTQNGTVNLYAQWTPVRYKITYVLNGGKNNTNNPASYNVTDKVSYSNPTREGYTFVGWYTDKQFKNKVTAISKGSTGSRKIYAKWKVNTYNVKFDGNGSTSGSMGTLKNKVYDVEYTISGNKYKRSNYTFAGWNTNANGTGTGYADGAKVKNLTAKNGGTAVLYAQWTPVSFSIKYVMNGGTNSANNPSTYSYNVNQPLATPVRSGYTFDGWYTDSAFKNKVTAIAAGKTGTVTLYAKWTKDKVWVECTACGGSGKQRCSKCGGTGKKLCVGCTRGYYYNTYTKKRVRHSACNATGYKSCGWCVNGKETCYTCGGYKGRYQ